MNESLQGLSFTERLLQGPPLVIAEIAQAHDGSLGTAHAYIDAVARAGADAVKFQTHIARAESTPGEPWRVKFSPQDETRYAYWQRMEFSEAQWQKLAEHARERGLFFLSTPFSDEAVDVLERVGVPAWKVASGEVNNLPLLERMARTGRPVLLSSGMSSWEDLDAAVACVQRHGAPVAVFQCTTAYPCPPERIGLNVLDELQRRYECPVGLSDHSGTIYPGVVATALGARSIEVHVVFSRECYGPDVPASITIDELQLLVEGVRFTATMRAHPVDKALMAIEMEELRRTFGKSLVARYALSGGQVVKRTDLALKKPGTGIPAARLDDFIGRRIKETVAPDTILTEDHFE